MDVVGREERGQRRNEGGDSGGWWQVRGIHPSRGWGGGRARQVSVAELRMGWRRILARVSSGVGDREAGGAVAESVRGQWWRIRIEGGSVVGHEREVLVPTS